MSRDMACCLVARTTLVLASRSPFERLLTHLPYYQEEQTETTQAGLELPARHNMDSGR
jgi:hypothetical protein